MRAIKVSLKIAVVAAGAGAAIAFGAGESSALSVQPIAGGNNIQLNRGETVALANARIAAPVVDTLLPGRRLDGERLTLGQGVQRSLDRAASKPGAWSGAKVYGPLNSPRKVELYHVSRR
ncbi:hypothetical protein [Gordonia aichiensis]|uniref:hypothetical protein n=1 Tax=Gordonia aichiensis TaxID=36820 RepID=UPI00326460CF